MSSVYLAQTKHLTELRYSVHFLPDRVDEKRLGLRYNSKGNTWKSRSCTHIKKMGVTSQLEPFASKRKEGIDQMEGDRILRICDARKVHSLVLLNNKLQIRNKQICLLGRNDNPILS